MKTPEKIKHGLEYCASEGACISDKCEYYAGGSIMCLVDLMRDALEYINELDEKAPMWISVKDILPEKKRRVMVYTTQGMYRLGAFTFVGKEGAVWFKCGRSFITGTHWMPLPEAPKEGE